MSNEATPTPAQLDFALLRASGVTQLEFAELVKVSRVTVSNWTTGATKVHELRVPRVARLLAAVGRKV